MIFIIENWMYIICPSNMLYKYINCFVDIRNMKDLPFVIN